MCNYDSCIAARPATMSQSDMSDGDVCSSEGEVDDYYANDGGDNMDTAIDSLNTTDPEYFEFQVLSIADVDRLLNESVARLQTSLQV